MLGELYRCPRCGARVIEEQFCSVHQLCDNCDDDCFPPLTDDELDELYADDELDFGDEPDFTVDPDDPTQLGWEP
ncbi:MAG TPA: hypothetical protein VI670_27790 [Thermoanaerobaculia bacterium]|jgi:hypothetical protein